MSKRPVGVEPLPFVSTGPYEPLPFSPSKLKQEGRLLILKHSPSLKHTTQRLKRYKQGDVVKAFVIYRGKSLPKRPSAKCPPPVRLKVVLMKSVEVTIQLRTPHQVQRQEKPLQTRIATLEAGRIIWLKSFYTGANIQSSAVVTVHSIKGEEVKDLQKTPYQQMTLEQYQQCPGEVYFIGKVEFLHTAGFHTASTLPESAYVFPLHSKDSQSVILPINLESINQTTATTWGLYANKSKVYKNIGAWVEELGGYPFYVKTIDGRKIGCSVRLYEHVLAAFGIVSPKAFTAFAPLLFECMKGVLVGYTLQDNPGVSAIVATALHLDLGTMIRDIGFPVTKEEVIVAFGDNIVNSPMANANQLFQNRHELYTDVVCLSEYTGNLANFWEDVKWDLFAVVDIPETEVEKTKELRKCLVNQTWTMKYYFAVKCN